MQIIKYDNLLFDKALKKFARQRVAIYCRVSKSNIVYNSSIEYQKEFLLKAVQEHFNWELVGIYSDVKSGLNIKKRKEFQRLIVDCLEGKIDIVLTKSMSRFSRNTVDLLNTVRLLNERGVKVMFELENFTYEDESSLEFEIRAVLNEEESIQKSRDIRWGIKKRQREGKYTFNANNLLGYRKTLDGNLEIIEDQAIIVRRIFSGFLNGKNFYQIAKGLEKDGILTGAGNSKWYPNKIKQILQNEKYVGDAHLGKYITTNIYDNIVKENKGITESYYVKDGHPAIISREDFEKVSNLINNSQITWKKQHNHI